MKKLSIVGKDFTTEEQAAGFYNAGDRMKFWGTRGAFWGSMCESSNQESIMSLANISRERAGGLPETLKMAQKAIHLPEVQEMLRRLSEYQLGIFMPHMHGEETGEFQLLPDGVVQVESGSEVSFQPTEEIADETNRFLPVGWRWRADALMPVAVCEMIEEEGQGATESSGKHKMKETCDASSARPTSHADNDVRRLG